MLSILLDGRWKRRDGIRIGDTHYSSIRVTLKLTIHEFMAVFRANVCLFFFPSHHASQVELWIGVIMVREIGTIVAAAERRFQFHANAIP